MTYPLQYDIQYLRMVSLVIIMVCSMYGCPKSERAVRCCGEDLVKMIHGWDHCCKVQCSSWKLQCSVLKNLSNKKLERKDKWIATHLQHVTKLFCNLPFHRKQLIFRKIIFVSGSHSVNCWLKHESKVKHIVSWIPVSWNITWHHVIWKVLAW